MIRAFLLDWMMIRSRAGLMAGMMTLICLWLTFQMRAFPGTYAAAIFMAYPMIAMSLGSYDEARGWSAVRLTLPVSRRDVVAGRYLLMGALALEGVAVAGAVTAAVLAADAVWRAAARDSFLPPELTAVGMPQATAVAACLTLLVTSVMTGIVTPLNFRFGATKVTMILPYVLLLGVLGGFALLGDAGADILAALPGLFDWLATASGALTACGVLLVATAAVMAVSAACSMAVYDRRQM